jgi:hypothetical protein
MGAEYLREGFGKVLSEVKAVRHLDGLGRAHTGTVHRGLQAIAGENRHTGVRT